MTDLKDVLATAMHAVTGRGISTTIHMDHDLDLSTLRMERGRQRLDVAFNAQGPYAVLSRPVKIERGPSHLARAVRDLEDQLELVRAAVEILAAIK
jgi:hypothetical protein